MKRMTPHAILLALLLPLGTCAPAHAASPQLQSLGPATRFVDPDFGLFEAYGLRVAGSGDTLVVGAPFAFPRERVDIFVRDGEGWSLQAGLLSPDGEDFDAFGDAVLLVGDELFVAATEHLGASGSVYVFERSGTDWSFRQRLRASDAASNARFGRSISSDGTRLVIGADGTNNVRGAVYAFTRGAGGWQQSQRIALAGAAQNDRFGFAVAVDGERMIVGAPGRDQAFTDQGAAYLYRLQNGSWTLESKLLRAQPANSDLLGRSVSLSGPIAAAGAPFAESGGPNDAGVVMTWRNDASGWSALAELSSPEASANGQFGEAISLRGPRLLVGLPGDAVGGNLIQGSAELFLLDDTGWQRRERIVLGEGATEDQFGAAVALADNFAAIGAPGTNIEGQPLAGAAYAFISRASQTTLTATPISARIGQTLTVTAAVETVEIVATGSVGVRDDAGAACAITLAQGAGSCQLTASEVGPRRIRALYGGAPGVSERFGELQVQVVPDLTITPATLPRAQIGRAYAASFDSPATGASLPLTWQQIAGSLPPGLTLAGSGSLSGTPTAFGSFEFSVAVTDSSSAALGGPFSESRAYTLVVDPPFTTTLTLTPASSEGDRGQSRVFSAQLSVVESGGEAPNGQYAVTASNGDSVLSCSAAVTGAGLQSCSIQFDAVAAVGDYTVSALFVSSSGDMAGSGDVGSHRLFSAADPSLSVLALDPVYAPGMTVRHRIQLQNAGPDTAFALTLESSLSSPLQDLQWNCSGSACPAAAGVGLPNLLIAALPASASIEFEVTGRLGAAVPGELELDASISLQPAGFSRELDANNNADSARSLPTALFGDGFETPPPP